MFIKDIPAANEIINASAGEAKVSLIRDGDTVARVGNVRRIEGTDPETAQVVITDSLTTFKIPLMEAIYLRQNGAFAIWS